MSDTTAGTAIIRKRTDADLPGAAAALVEVHATDGYPVEGVDDPEAWLTGPTLLRAWVGELDGQIVGHVAMSRPQTDDAAATAWGSTSEGAHDSIAVLGRLFVLRSARGHSLGRNLVHTATTYAQRNGLRLVLDVMKKDGAAIRLYESLGWRQIGSVDHNDGTGRLIPAICFVGPQSFS